MNGSTVFDYYGDESSQFSFYRIPCQLVTGQQFKKISTDAKLLYGLLLDRMGLSARNGWYDDAGRVYIFYTLDEIQEDLNCGHEKDVKLLSELDNGNIIFHIDCCFQNLSKPRYLNGCDFHLYSLHTTDHDYACFIRFYDFEEFDTLPASIR